MVICMFCILSGQVGQAESPIHTDYEWTLEPSTDGNLHIGVKVTLGVWDSEWVFNVPKSSPAQNVTAYEAESKKPIKIVEADEGDKTEYRLDFQEGKKRGFQFVIEYDKAGNVEVKYDTAYYFYNGWTSYSETTHTATVILPKNHELILTNYVEPEETFMDHGQVAFTVTQELPPEETFRIGVMFSAEGKRLLELAERNFRMKDYREARDYYQQAYNFYSKFSNLYDRDKDAFLAEIKTHIDECDGIFKEKTVGEAEDRYDQAIQAFDNKEYEEALKLFASARKLYLTIEETEKADECQEYMAQCTDYQKKEELTAEAEQLLQEGIDHYEQGLYEEAETTFNQALEKFQEVGDEEKVQECQQWIESCGSQKEEEPPESTGFCLGSFLIVFLQAGTILIRKNL
jgi:tetratricopeptide (TPR) repeat protein